MRTMTRNGPGTWSSDREEVMSAAAECFWGQQNRLSTSGSSQRWKPVPFKASGGVETLAPTYPKGPEAEDDDDEVHSVGQEHQHIHISHSTVVWVDEVIEELPNGYIDL